MRVVSVLPPGIADWQTLVDKFKGRTLTSAQWTHAAHLVVALAFVLEHKDVGTTMCYVRPGIVLLNVAMGHVNTTAGGYHETTTSFWVRQIHAFVETRASRDFDVLVEQLLRDTPFLDKEYVLRFYPRDVLRSPLARGTYLEPHEGSPPSA